MSNSADLRIVIPAYNEESRIVPTLRDYCGTFGDGAHVVVVANGCSDGTAAVVRELQREFFNLSLIDIPNAIGKGGAVRVGLATGNEPFVGFVDADGSTVAGEFMRLYEALRNSASDAVVGSRWLAESKVEPRQPLVRRLASRTFNAIVRLLFGLPLSDTQCGAKLFRRDALRTILMSLEVADFAFDIEVLWLLKRFGKSIAEVPTSWADRAAGTKIRLFSSSWGMLASVLRLRLRYTLLWGIPFVDYLGRRNVIPVRRSRRMLVLGAAVQAPPIQVAPLFAALRNAGVHLLDASDARNWGRSPLAFLMWYVFRSRREYDAVIELAGEKLWMIPWLSVKPSFIIETSDRPARASYRRWYGRSTFVNLSQQDVQTAADVMLTTAYVSALHPTVFVGGDEALSFQYRDRRTGVHTSHILQ
jgi:glycosyltransferase involved in cell wall biosynthesis